MGKGRFLNQKLGKRTSRRRRLEKARLQDLRMPGGPGAPGVRVPKKGSSREQRLGR